MARAGRPRKQGPRTKSGRLKQQHDAGTDCLAPYISPFMFGLSNAVFAAERSMEGPL